jgi:DNA mismatch repair protein MutH
MVSERFRSLGMAIPKFRHASEGWHPALIKCSIGKKAGSQPSLRCRVLRKI